MNVTAGRTPPTDPLTEALAYAARGWRLLPITPGQKYPPIKAWQDAATTDTTIITSWWTGLYKDHGIGIATGPGSGIWVLDVDDYEAFRQLEQDHEPLPDTLTSITGSGGYHFLFTYPTDGTVIRNNAGTRLGQGLDVRGDGGQIVAPPTIHPNGNAYAWDTGQGDQPVQAPAWLIELVADRPAGPAPIVLRDTPSGSRPGDEWAAATDWAQILEPDGWQLHHADRTTGERFWTRPGKTTRDGASATTGWSSADTLHVFTSSMATWGLVEEETYTKLGYVATTRHRGDHTAAARSLAEQGWGTRQEDTIMLAPPPPPGPDGTAEVVDPIGGWEFVDLDEILTGDHVAPVPTLGLRSDGIGLIYPGRVHSISGEPGGGKTWLALHMIAEVITNGGTGALIDYEDTPSACVHRLRLLGLTDDQIRTQFHYVRPDGPLITKSGRVDVGTLAKLEELVVDIIVIDSVGESLAVEGLPPNDDDAVTQWFRRLPRMLARRGAAVIGLDHVTKSKDDRGLWAIGSQRKLAAIDGAAYGVDVKVAPTKTKDGKLTVTCAKDRHGTYQRGHLVASVAIDNVGHGVQVILTAPENRFRPTHYMEKVSRMLEEIPSASGRGIEQAVPGKAEHIRIAIECLVEEQFVSKDTTGRGNQYTSVTAFREIEAVDNSPRPTASHRVPAERDAVPGDPESHRVPRVPDPTEGGSGGDAVRGPGQQPDEHPPPRPRPDPTLEGMF